jgi:hypothetical protein
MPRYAAPLDDRLEGIDGHHLERETDAWGKHSGAGGDRSYFPFFLAGMGLPALAMAVEGSVVMHTA